MSERLFSAMRWAAITPSDTATLEPFPVVVFIGGAGVVVAVGHDGVSASFTVPAGAVLSIQPRQIKATGTTATATDIVALFN